MSIHFHDVQQMHDSHPAMHQFDGPDFPVASLIPIDSKFQGRSIISGV